MKAIRTNATQQQGLKKTYDASLEAARRTNHDCKEVIAALQKIEPIISEDATTCWSKTL